MKIIYTADYVDNILKIRGRKQFDKDIADSGYKVFTVTLENARGKRSLNQNAYYRACVIPILQQGIAELGHKFSRDTVHEMMKAKFLTEDIPLNDSGEFITRIKSTTELNKEQFGDYIDQINAWGIEYLGVTIPPPNTQTELL